MKCKTKIAAALIALSFAACGDGNVQMLDTDENSRYGNGGGNHEQYLESIDPLPLQTEASSSVALRIALKKSGVHAPVASQAITFEVTQSADMQTSLSALSAITDDNGVATVDLRLGMLAGPATVTATTPGAAPLEIPVTVDEATTGKIRVDISPPANAPVEIAPYRLSFFETSTFDCSAYRPRDRGPNPITEVHVPDTTPTEQGGFPPGTAFTVVAEGLGNGGFTLAGGCADGITVLAGDTKVVPVQLEMAPITPSGTFAVESIWDISDAVGSQNGASGALVRVIEFMANPGESIYDMVMEAVDDAVGFNIDLLLNIAGIKERAIDYINGQLFRYGSVETFSAVAADLDTMLNELQVKSTLDIAKTDDDYNFHGSEEWTSVTVSWTWQCEDRNSPDCTTHEVDLTENGAAAGAVSYDWTGRVEGYDKLIVESHQAQIDIGRLQLFLLEQVILPQLTDGAANSIGEALAFWIDCGTLASRALQGAEVCDPTGILCLGEDEAEAACEIGLEQLGNFIEGPIEDQSTALDIELSGEATLVDADANGVADGIIEGMTEGTLSGSTEPVVVQWAGQVQN